MRASLALLWFLAREVDLLTMVVGAYDSRTKWAIAWGRKPQRRAVKMGATPEWLRRFLR